MSQRAAYPNDWNIVKTSFNCQQSSCDQQGSATKSRLIYKKKYITPRKIPYDVSSMLFTMFSKNVV